MRGKSLTSGVKDFAAEAKRVATAYNEAQGNFLGVTCVLEEHIAAALSRRHKLSWNGAVKKAAKMIQERHGIDAWQIPDEIRALRIK